MHGVTTKLGNAQQARHNNTYINTKLKLLKANAERFNVLMCKFYKFYICAVVGLIIE